MKLQFLQHRVNTLDDLKRADPKLGVEMDVRGDCRAKGRIYVSHDPWNADLSFERWLSHYLQFGFEGTIAINIKEDGLEDEIEETCARFGVRNYFFVDAPGPALVRSLRRGNSERHSIRISQYEPLAAALPFAGKMKWAWVDCFDGIPLSYELVSSAREYFSICLLSPELHGKALGEIEKFKSLLPLADAVCTKSPETWQKLITAPRKSSRLFPSADGLHS